MAGSRHDQNSTARVQKLESTDAGTAGTSSNLHMQMKGGRGRRFSREHPSPRSTDTATLRSHLTIDRSGRYRSHPSRSAAASSSRDRGHLHGRGFASQAPMNWSAVYPSATECKPVPTDPWRSHVGTFGEASMLRANLSRQCGGSYMRLCTSRACISRHVIMLPPHTRAQRADSGD